MGCRTHNVVHCVRFVTEGMWTLECDAIAVLITASANWFFVTGRLHENLSCPNSLEVTFACRSHNVTAAPQCLRIECADRELALECANVCVREGKQVTCAKHNQLFGVPREPVT